MCLIPTHVMFGVVQVSYLREQKMLLGLAGRTFIVVGQTCLLSLMESQIFPAPFEPNPKKRKSHEAVLHCAPLKCRTQQLPIPKTAVGAGNQGLHVIVLGVPVPDQQCEVRCSMRDTSVTMCVKISNALHGSTWIYKAHSSKVGGIGFSVVLQADLTFLLLAPAFCHLHHIAGLLQL